MEQVFNYAIRTGGLKRGDLFSKEDVITAETKVKAYEQLLKEYHYHIDNAVFVDLHVWESNEHLK